MAERIDEARIIAWIDGELPPREALDVEQAVAGDAALAAVAETHRAMKARFAAAFGPIADESVALPRSADVIPITAARAKRAERTPPRRWWVPGAIAASLALGLVIGQYREPAGVADRADALALAAPLSHALDRQLSGEPGQVRIALSFRAQDGAYCRSFTATHLAGVACRSGEGWSLRYAAPDGHPGGDYRMAGNDPAEASAIAALIAGDPLNAAGEREARAKGWR